MVGSCRPNFLLSRCCFRCNDSVRILYIFNIYIRTLALDHSTNLIMMLLQIISSSAYQKLYSVCLPVVRCLLFLVIWLMKEV